MASLRAARPDEDDALRALWEASLGQDDPAGWPRGGWSLAAWATDTRVLVLRERVVGIAAVRADPAHTETVAIRAALDPTARQPALATRLVQAGVDLAQAAGARAARLWAPSLAGWMRAAARENGFGAVRTVAHMLLPAEAPTPVARVVPGLTIRPMATGEEHAVLAALNRAWAGTWEFVPIPVELLLRDLDGQRQGMLLGSVGASGIIATCHAVFDPSQQNPDGYPRAWISNLTVDPDQRGKGVARALLVAGIEHLRQRGAASITLGVDAGAPAPLRLYQSAGFAIVSSMEAWDKALS